MAATGVVFGPDRNFNKATKPVNLTRNPALFLLAQNSTEGACPTKVDVPLHYSGRSIASKTAGAIRYRLPLPMNAEGDMVLVISMLARAAKNGSSEDVHGTISVAGGTPQVESLNPGTLVEALQMWIPRGGPPEEYAVHLHVAHPTWQWPNFVPGTLKISQGTSGKQLATSEFYGSLFLEVRTAPAVVLTTVQVLSGASVSVAASGEARILAGSSTEQPSAWTVPGLLNQLALSAAALVLCAIVAMWAQEQQCTNTILSRHADGKGNFFAALKQWLEQQVEPAPRKPAGFTDEELLLEEFPVQKSSKSPKKTAPKTGAGRSSRKATESMPLASAAASSSGKQNKAPEIHAAPHESAKANAARQASSNADGLQTKTKQPQARQPKLAKPDHVPEDTWAALPLELQKELAGSYPASWSPDLSNAPSMSNETRADKLKQQRDREQQDQREKHKQEQRQKQEQKQKQKQKKQQQEQQQQKQNQPQHPQEQRTKTKEVQVEMQKEEDAATKKEHTEKGMSARPTSHAEQQPQQQPNNATARAGHSQTSPPNRTGGASSSAASSRQPVSLPPGATWAERLAEKPAASTTDNEAEELTASASQAGSAASTQDDGGRRTPESTGSDAASPLSTPQQSPMSSKRPPDAAPAESWRPPVAVAPMHPQMLVHMMPMLSPSPMPPAISREQLGLYLDSISGSLDRVVMDWSGCEMLLHHIRGMHGDLVVSRLLHGLSHEMLPTMFCDDTAVHLSIGLIQRCNTPQRLHILRAIGPCIFRISSSANGSWVMQAMINNLDSKEEVERLQRALKGRVAAMMIGSASSQVLLACGSRMRFLGANNFIFREIAQGINSIVQSQPAVDCFNSLIAVASPRQASNLAASISTYVMRLAQHKLGNYLVQMVLDRAYSGSEDHEEEIVAEDTEGAKKMLRIIGNSTVD